MEVFMGTISAFGFNYAPYGWALCQGQLLSISQNTALFSLLGTQFGGNGTSTFGLPDLIGHKAIGKGQGAGLPDYVVGETAGQNTTTLTTANIPPHTHGITVAINSNTRSQSSTNPANNFPAQAATTGTNNYAPAPSSGVQMGGNVAITLTATGSTAPLPFATESAYLVSNYSIAMQGIFPQRN